MAVYASPRQTVIAGPPEQVDAVIAVVAARDRLARRIDVEVASHHRIVDPILPELRSQLADVTPAAPTIPVISTTGDHDRCTALRCRLLGRQSAQPGALRARPSPPPPNTTPPSSKSAPTPCSPTPSPTPWSPLRRPPSAGHLGDEP